MPDRYNINLLYQISRTLCSRQIHQYESTLIDVFGWDVIFRKMWSRRHTMEDRALLVMLLTGCRVSEVDTIKVKHIKDETVIIIDCQKQHRSRVMHIGSDSVLTALLPITPAYAVMETSQKQLSRYMHRNYQELIPDASFRGHKACHVMRYMYIAILSECFDLSHHMIQGIMQWSEEELVDTYLEYLKYMMSSGIKRGLTLEQTSNKLRH